MTLPAPANYAWMAAAVARAKAMGVDLDQLLFGADIAPGTRKSYEAEWARIKLYLARHAGIPDYAQSTPEALATAMRAYLKKAVLRSATGNLAGLVDLAAAAFNYFSLCEDRGHLNPFKLESLRRLRKSIARSTKLVRQAAVKKQPIMPTDGRFLSSHLLRVELTRSPTTRRGPVQAALRLRSLVNMAQYKGARGDTLRRFLIDHLALFDDPLAAAMPTTLWVFVPFKKNDPDGRGEWFPVLRMRNDGYLCPLLAWATYTLAMKEELLAMDRASPRVPGKVRSSFYLYGGSGSNGNVDLGMPWGASACRRSFQSATRAAFGAARASTLELSLHSGRHGQWGNHARTNQCSTRLFLWAPWRAHADAGGYAHRDPATMRTIAAELVEEERVEEGEVCAPYALSQRGCDGLSRSGSHVLRLLEYAATIVALHQGEPELKAWLLQADFGALTERLSRLLPPYAPAPRFVPARLPATALGPPPPSQARALLCFSGGEAPAGPARPEEGLGGSGGGGSAELRGSCSEQVGTGAEPALQVPAAAEPRVVAATARLPLPPPSAIGWRLLPDFFYGHLAGYPPNHSLLGIRRADSPWAIQQQGTKAVFSQYMTLMAELTRVTPAGSRALLSSPPSPARAAVIDAAVAELQRLYPPGAVSFKDTYRALAKKHARGVLGGAGGHAAGEEALAARQAILCELRRATGARPAAGAHGWGVGGGASGGAGGVPLRGRKRQRDTGEVNV